MSRPRGQATCHPERRHSAKGLCGQCYKAAYYSANKPRALSEARRLKLRSRFGLTEADYERMRVAQGGVCCLCFRAEPDGRRLAVDHDHHSGAVRGLLCRRCNHIVVGTVESSPGYLNRLVEYVTRGRRPPFVTPEEHVND